MASTGTKKLPYPQPSEPIAQGADAIRKLAQSVDNMVQAGAVTVAIGTANLNQSQAVAFPVPFNSAPYVCITPISGPTPDFTTAWWVTAVTANGFTAWSRRSTTGNFTAHWVAVGSVVAVT
jgi:hypothetical protein